MSGRINYLTDKYLEYFTSCLYRDIKDQDLCVEIITSAIRDATESRKNFEEDIEFLFLVKEKMYRNLYQRIRKDSKVCLEIKSRVDQGQPSLSDVYREISSSSYPRSEIAHLGYIEKCGPAEISKRTGISINTIKYHLKKLKERLPGAGK